LLFIFFHFKQFNHFNCVSKFISLDPKGVDTLYFQLFNNYNTHFIEKNKKFLENFEKCQGDCKAMAIIAAFVDYQSRLSEAQQKISSGKSDGNWKLYNRKKTMLRIH